MRIPFVTDHFQKRKERIRFMEETEANYRDRREQKDKDCSVYIELHGDVGKKFYDLWLEYHQRENQSSSAIHYKMDITLKPNEYDYFKFFGGFPIEAVEVENDVGKAYRFRLLFDGNKIELFKFLPERTV